MSVSLNVQLSVWFQSSPTLIKITATLLLAVVILLLLLVVVVVAAVVYNNISNIIIHNNALTADNSQHMSLKLKLKVTS